MKNKKRPSPLYSAGQNLNNPFYRNELCQVLSVIWTKADGYVYALFGLDGMVFQVKESFLKTAQKIEKSNTAT